MNGFLAATSLGVAAALGPLFSATRGEPPPRPVTGETLALPGKIPKSEKEISTGWHYGHYQKNAQSEGVPSGDLLYGFLLFLEEDGSYRLEYGARWGLPSASVSIGSIPIPTGNVALDGFNVSETGKYSLSGEILLLEPSDTRRREVEDNRMLDEMVIPNTNRALIVRVDGRRLHVAGRCASYQVEPVCREAKTVWYELKRQIGSGRPGEVRR